MGILPLLLAVAPCFAQPTTLPATQPVGKSLGQYMIVGAVIAEANGQPIYAHKVLAKVEPALARQAIELRARPLNEFRAVANDLISGQVRSDIGNELEFAAAQRLATDEEINQASALTTTWRQKEIIKRGGSIAVTRRIWRETEPVEFDDQVQEQFRVYMVGLYLERRVYPLVQVSADDLREFYDRNRDQMFTEKAAVKFRAILVEPARTGTRQAAMEKIVRILDRVKKGESFATLAGQQNDDRNLMKNGGWWDVRRVERSPGIFEIEPVWIGKGDLRQDRFGELEKVLFTLDQGQVSDPPIDLGDRLYLVKIEEKQPGKVREFEDQEVQAFIKRRLETEQRQALRQREQQRLFSGAVLRVDEKMVKTAVDMAVQRYYISAAEGAGK